MKEYTPAFVFFAALGLVSFILWRFVSALRSEDIAVRKKATRKAWVAVGFMLVVAAGLAIAARLYIEIDLHVGDAGRFAARDGRTVHLHPSDVTFQIPRDWLEWESRFHNNFHLTHRELREVRVGSGEWDSEYGSVVNAAMPFEHCAAHVGGEGWGSQGVSFGDLQLRAYITDLSTRDILAHVQGPGLSTAKGIAASEGGWVGGRANFSVTADKSWQHATIDYPLWYGDYGRGFENEEIFILNSVSIPAR
jgi:hypothetical protein